MTDEWDQFPDAPVVTQQTNQADEWDQFPDAPAETTPQLDATQRRRTALKAAQDEMVAAAKSSGLGLREISVGNGPSGYQMLDKDGNIVEHAAVDKWQKLFNEEVEAFNTGGLRSMVGGLTLGASQHVEAGVRALAGGGSYQKNLDEQRAQQKEYAHNNPVASLVTNLTGSAPMIAASGGSSLLANAAAGGAVSGATALMDNVGGSDDTVVGAAKSAAGMAAVGAGAALVPGVAKYAKDAVAVPTKAIWSGITNLLGTGTKPAMQTMLNKAVAADAKAAGMAIDDYVTQLNSHASSGTEGSIVTSGGPALQKLFREAKEAGADTAQFETRMGQHAERVRDTISKNNQPFLSEVGAAKAKLKADGDAAYGAFKAQPSVATDFSAVPKSPVFSDAIEQANQSLATEGLPTIRLIGNGAQGTPIYDLKQLSATQADYLARVVGKMTDDAFAKGVDSKVLPGSLKKLRETVDDVVESSYPGYRKVRSDYFGNSSSVKQLESGRKAGLSPGPKRDAAEVATPEYSRGAVQALDDKLGGAGGNEFLGKLQGTDTEAYIARHAGPKVTTSIQEERFLAEQLKKLRGHTKDGMSSNQLAMEMIAPYGLQRLIPGGAATYSAIRGSVALAGTKMNQTRATALAEALSQKAIQQGVIKTPQGPGMKKALISALMAGELADQ